MSKTPKTLLFSDLAGLTVLRNLIEGSEQQNYGKKKLLTMIDNVISRVTRQMVQPDVTILQAMQEGLSSMYSAISSETSQPIIIIIIIIIIRRTCPLGRCPSGRRALVREREKYKYTT